MASLARYWRTWNKANGGWHDPHVVNCKAMMETAGLLWL
jgi:hypothetical protein